MVDVLNPASTKRNGDALPHILKSAVVPLSVGNPLSGDEVDLPDQTVAHHGLQRVKAAIDAEGFYFVAVGKAMIAVQAQLLGHFIGMGHDHTAVRPDVEVFQRVETVAGSEPPGAGRMSVQVRPDRLAGIFDDREVVATGDFRDSGHVGHIAGVVHGYDRAGSWGNGGLDLRSVDDETVFAIDDTGRAPVMTMAPTVAMNVIGVVITSSPAPTPAIFKDMAMASVPVPTPMA